MRRGSLSAPSARQRPPFTRTAPAIHGLYVRINAQRIARPCRSSARISPGPRITPHLAPLEQARAVLAGRQCRDRPVDKNRLMKAADQILAAPRISRPSCASPATSACAVRILGPAGCRMKIAVRKVGYIRHNAPPKFGLRSDRPAALHRARSASSSGLRPNVSASPRPQIRSSKERVLSRARRATRRDAASILRRNNEQLPRTE